MRVVITGSTGMIGLAMTKYLISQGIEVIMLIREGSDKINLLPESSLIKVIECNLDNLKNLEATQNADIFLHFGWDKTIGIQRNDVDCQLSNISYTLDAIKLAKKMGCKKFIGAGSQAEYGIKDTPVSINTSCEPITGYGIAKYAAGKLSKILCEQLDMQFNWLRILSIYGEHDNTNTLIAYVKRCLIQGISPDVTKCEQIWDYLEVNEAVKLIWLVAKNGQSGVFYPLGSGEGHALSYYLEKLKQEMNSYVSINYGAKEYTKDQVMYLVADMSYLKDIGGSKE